MAPGFVARAMKQVPARRISAAMRPISTSPRPSASSTAPAGFPAKARVVKMSAWTNGTARPTPLPARCRRPHEGERLLRGVLRGDGAEHDLVDRALPCRHRGLHGCRVLGRDGGLDGLDVHALEVRRVSGNRRVAIALVAEAAHRGLADGEADVGV